MLRITENECEYYLWQVMVRTANRCGVNYAEMYDKNELREKIPGDVWEVFEEFAGVYRKYIAAGLVLDEMRKTDDFVEAGREYQHQLDSYRQLMTSRDETRTALVRKLDGL